MRELIRVKKTTQHALNVGKKTLKFARQMKKADNKTRFKTTAKLLALITLGFSKWFVRETWHTASTKTIIKEEWNPYTKTYEHNVVGTEIDKDMIALGNIFSTYTRKVTKYFIKKFNK